MSEIPSIGSPQFPDIPVCMVMTGAAFNAAGRANIQQIEADLHAMAIIAQHVGHIAYNHVTELGPQLFVVRDASGGRRTIGDWDTHAPTDATSPVTERYVWANDLNSEHPRSSERIKLVEIAHTIGAPTLTELTVPTWNDDATLPKVYATGLLFAQKPIQVQGKSSLLSRVTREVTDSLRGRIAKRLKLRNEVDELAHGPLPIAAPFILHRGVKKED